MSLNVLVKLSIDKPVSILVKAVSTLVESKADVSMNDSEFRSEIVKRY